MELREALTQISEIRRQVARSHLFRGYRALPVAFSGLTALLVAGFQQVWLPDPTHNVTAYLALLDDRYPSTDEEQAVHLDLAYPDARQLNRYLPLIKWFLAIPHYVVLVFLWLAAIACIIVAWFAILFTGRYPRGLFDFLVGVGRWTNRVTGYAFTLVTDQYPPFRLSP